ncbi:MAG: PACE efflux transporter [Paludibacterium sp.]|uniref:PACE efflux transporter n=1 Tax=Paludibacterium sp. TaxID=1917523 RepID=UPI002600167A|nr:PACE efflux transporter [Paludibacterium sp.]MBV8045945.1 PACE efflux transporter [Paludibacterium sp.]MBV8647891.1 PACE efflux transporter [Paludibacterium sp.]
MDASKSPLERWLQAIGFELGGIALVTPLFAWWVGTSMAAMGGLAVLNCLVALGWNVLFNAAYDRVLRASGWAKTAAVRAGHALLFEGGLMLVCLPLAMAWLSLDFWAALKLDIGLNLVFLPYTYVYHWGYDAFRQRLVGQV